MLDPGHAAGAGDDIVGAQRFGDAVGELRAVAADEFRRVVVAEIDARRDGQRGVLERHRIAFAVAEIAVVEVEGALRQLVREDGLGFVAALDFHLEQAAGGAILGLDLHRDARPAAGQHDIGRTAQFNADGAVQDQAPVIGHLAVEDGRCLAARDVFLVGGASQRVIEHAERGGIDIELDVAALYPKHRCHGARRDRHRLRAAFAQYREAAALAAGRICCVRSLRSHQQAHAASRHPIFHAVLRCRNVAPDALVF